MAVIMEHHRDVVGEWQKAAKKNGLPFGVSEHISVRASPGFRMRTSRTRPGRWPACRTTGADSNNWDLYHFPAEPGDTGNGIPRIPAGSSNGMMKSSSSWKAIIIPIYFTATAA